MANRRVKITEVGPAIEEILAEYKGNIITETRKAVYKVAEVAKKETQSGAPVDKRSISRRGRYKRGWAVKKEEESRLRSSAIVHNRTDYQLAHLLEKGHAKVNGGRTSAIKHIEPAEQHAEKNLEEALVKIAENG